MFLATGLFLYIVSTWWGSAAWSTAALVCFLMVLSLMDLSSAASAWTWTLKSHLASVAVILAPQALVLVSDWSLMKTGLREREEDWGKTFLNVLEGGLQVSTFREKLNNQRLCRLKKDKTHITSIYLSTTVLGSERRLQWKDLHYMGCLD